MEICTFEDIEQLKAKYGELFMVYDFVVKDDIQGYSAEEIKLVCQLRKEDKYVIFFERKIEDVITPLLKEFIENKRFMNPVENDEQ